MGDFMTVTFCGHREILSGEDEIKGKLKIEVEKAIMSGSTEFLLGGYGKFDLMCAGVVKELKEKYPSVKSVLVKAYLNAKFDFWMYDEAEYPPIENTIKRFAIIKRNEYMVDKSDLVIAYVKNDTGGAATTLKYALKTNKKIINIAL